MMYIYIHIYICYIYNDSIPKYTENIPKYVKGGISLHMPHNLDEQGRFPQNVFPATKGGKFINS